MISAVLTKNMRGIGTGVRCSSETITYAAERAPNIITIAASMTHIVMR